MYEEAAGVPVDVVPPELMLIGVPLTGVPVLLSTGVEGALGATPVTYAVEALVVEEVPV